MALTTPLVWSRPRERRPQFYGRGDLCPSPPRKGQTGFFARLPICGVAPLAPLLAPANCHDGAARRTWSRVAIAPHGSGARTGRGFFRWDIPAEGWTLHRSRTLLALAGNRPVYPAGRRQSPLLECHQRAFSCAGGRRGFTMAGQEPPDAKLACPWGGDQAP